MFDGSPSPDRFRAWLGQLRDVLEVSLGDLDRLDRATPSSTAAQRLELARRWLAERRERTKAFGRQADLFCDPAWDMMLDLYVHREVKPVSVSAACIAGNCPPTTALRHLKVLQERGLVERKQHPGDKRSQFMTLSGEGFELMEDLLARSLVHRRR